MIRQGSNILFTWLLRSSSLTSNSWSPQPLLPPAAPHAVPTTRSRRSSTQAAWRGTRRPGSLPPPPSTGALKQSSGPPAWGGSSCSSAVSSHRSSSQLSTAATRPSLSTAATASGRPPKLRRARHATGAAAAAPSPAWHTTRTAHIGGGTTVCLSGVSRTCEPSTTAAVPRWLTAGAWQKPRVRKWPAAVIARRRSGAASLQATLTPCCPGPRKSRCHLRYQCQLLRCQSCSSVAGAPPAPDAGVETG